MTTSFWKDALASLSPEIRHRYAADFEAAERYEYVLDLIIEGWGYARHALAKSCQAAALGLRTAARCLDAAAQRLFPTY